MDAVAFGRYRLIELLGRGGMGDVWQAFDTVTDRVVALKVLPPEYAHDAVFGERFRREVRSAAALDEPHVIPLHDFGEIGGRLFVTMRLIKGRGLHHILNDGPIDAVRAVKLIDQVASALHAAHEVNLVHRDVKPSNILVTDDDFAYLIDFGMARAAGQISLTGDSSVAGTWAYLAPERLTTGRTDSRADVYALACVLYECLTGRQPFSGEGLEQQIGGHLALPPPRASDHAADVPAQLDAVIAKGMAKNPDDRFATTRELARSARAAVTESPTVPRQIPRIPAAPLDYPYAYEYPDDQWSTDAAQFRPLAPGPTQVPPVPGPKPPASKRSRTGRLVALSGVGVLAVLVAIVAVVAAMALSNSGDNHPKPQAESTTTTPTALPNTGPLTGAFTVAMGRGGTDWPPYSETWRLRSVCASDGCIATASTGGVFPVKDLVFDRVNGTWLAVSTSRIKCNLRDDDEAWDVIALQTRPNGTLSGESIQMTANGCSIKRTVTLTREGDTDVSQLPDPTSLPPRVVSPAAALRGQYDSLESFSSGYKNEVRYGVRTDCLRTGDRCISSFSNDQSGMTFVFSNGVWTRNEEFISTCSLGGEVRSKLTGTLPIPQPAQDPITLLTGHGYYEVITSGAKCKSQTLDERFTRVGD